MHKKKFIFHTMSQMKGFENFLILSMIVIFPLNIPSRVILVVLALHIPPLIIDTLRKQCRRTLWGLEDKSDYLALFQSGGADYAHHISTCQIF